MMLSGGGIVGLGKPEDDSVDWLFERSRLRGGGEGEVVCKRQ